MPSTSSSFEKYLKIHTSDADLVASSNQENLGQFFHILIDNIIPQATQLLKDALNAQADYKNDFFIYAACGGKRDMMYDVNAALIAAMVADTDDFSYGTDPAQNNLYYSISGEIHQTLMSRFYFYNAFDVVFK